MLIVHLFVLNCTPVTFLYSIDWANLHFPLSFGGFVFYGVQVS